MFTFFCGVSPSSEDRLGEAYLDCLIQEDRELAVGDVRDVRAVPVAARKRLKQLADRLLDCVMLKVAEFESPRFDGLHGGAESLASH